MAKIGSQDWADSQLRFIIAILQGKICQQSWKGKLQLALIAKQRLLDYGFLWHARRVDNWIHRYTPKLAQLPKGDDLSEREREEPSSKKFSVYLGDP
jgi:hypothetical protein